MKDKLITLGGTTLGFIISTPIWIATLGYFLIKDEKIIKKLIIKKTKKIFDNFTK